MTTTTTTTLFPVPMVMSNTNSWGPPSISSSTSSTTSTTTSTNATTTTTSTTTPILGKTDGIYKFVGLPYAPFGRSDRLGGGGGGGGGGGNYHHGGHNNHRISGAVADFMNPPPPAGSSSNNNNNMGSNEYNRRNNNSNDHRDNYRDQQRLRYASQFADNNDGNDPEQQEMDDDTTNFQLVDTSKGTSTNNSSAIGGNKKFVNPTIKRRQQIIRLRQINTRRLQSTGGAAAANASLDYMVSSSSGRGGGFGGRGGPGGGRGAPIAGRGGRGGYYNNNNNNRIIDRQPSVTIQPTWNLCEEIDLSKLTKHLTASTAVPKVSDVVWCGFLDVYNDIYDKVSTRTNVPLKHCTNKEFYPVTTTDDPVLEKCAVDGEGQIFITDTILAHLMTCTRSVYPWDIVVTKLSSPGNNNIYFFDKRNTSTFDYLTVQETAYIQPQIVEDEHGHNINSIERLGLEATMINQNFTQQIIRKALGRHEMELPNPFFDEDDDEDDDDDDEVEKPKPTTKKMNTKEPASIAYRYRKFALESNLNVICRTELHGIIKKNTTTQYMTAFALNEYIPPTPSTSSSGTAGPVSSTNTSSNWRDKIDNQRGAILANELKNNSFKFAKWTAQSILAGADQMKIGFISKATGTNPSGSKGSANSTTNTTTTPSEHVILGTQFYRPSDFAQQITLQEGQMWCMFRTFIASIDKYTKSTSTTTTTTTSKFVIMRHPNKPILHIYQVPPDTFDDE